MCTNILTIDIGNSRSHWGIFTDGNMTSQGNLSSRSGDIDFTPLFFRESTERGLDGIVACSVVPRASDQLRRQTQAAGIRCEFLTHENVGPLRIHYPQPHQIGPDRLANALGGLIHTTPPFIVIDMGTAVTLDAVTASNGYEGGAIAPGFAFLSEYLSEKTALLPKLDMSQIRRRTGIGRSTEEAMEIGCTKGFAGMIRELVATTAEEIRSIDGREPQVIVTGGSFAWVKESWIGSLPFYPHLTLEGVLSRAKELLSNSSDSRK